MKWLQRLVQISWFLSSFSAFSSLAPTQCLTGRSKMYLSVETTANKVVKRFKKARFAGLFLCLREIH